MSHNTIGAYDPVGNDIGAYDAGAPATAGAGGEFLRRRREYIIRRRVGKRIGARETWWGQRRTGRKY
jgi:hypothetical protein